MGTLLLAACATSPAASEREAGGVGAALPTPQRSLSPQIAATVNLLTAHLAPHGYRLVQVTRLYRPSEPEMLAAIPRAVFQLDQSEPDEGYVVVYEFRDPEAAAAGGRELAGYLASGFGQTNYPVDAQFALAQMGGTLVLGWWSPERSSMPDRVRRALQLFRGFGQPIPVPK
ncbi:MAG: hypothetical protein M3301_01025 [Chloroflexota bacterium]|nr:hypothetical protein [Chloroflexota bacterium]